MPPQSAKTAKATLLKLFIVNNDGEYAGEYAVEEDCTVEFDDCLNIMGDNPVEDMQTLFLGELRVTMLLGTNFNLIAISKGPLGIQEITWAKATLTTTEAVFTRVFEERRQQPAKNPQLESELRAVKGKLSVAESKLEVEKSKAARETRALMDQMRALQSQAGRLGEMEKQLAAAASKEQMLRREMLSRQETMKGIEMTISKAMEREESLRRQFESVKAENENLRGMAANLEQTKRQVEGHMEMINRKAMELLEREDRLKEKEQNARTVPLQGLRIP